MDDKDEKFENILILENLVEANLMQKILEEEGIPFFIREWHDVNYDGIFVEQKGYGWLMGRADDKDMIKEIYDERISR